MATGSGLGTTATFDSVAIGNLNQLDWSGISTETIDMTNFDATSVIASDTLTANTTHISNGVVDGGIITLSGDFDPDDNATTKHGAVIPKIGKTATLTIAWQGTAITWAASAILTSADVSAPYSEKMTVSMTLKITGDITITGTA